MGTRDKAKDKDLELERKVREALKRRAGFVRTDKDGLKEIKAKIKSNRGKRIK